MSDFLKYVDLASDSLNVALVLDTVLLEYLDGYFLTCDRMSAYPDLSKCARSE